MLKELDRCTFSNIYDAYDFACDASRFDRVKQIKLYAPQGVCVEQQQCEVVIFGL
jgi:hypothetical protein